MCSGICPRMVRKRPWWVICSGSLQTRTLHHSKTRISYMHSKCDFVFHSVIVLSFSRILLATKNTIILFKLQLATCGEWKAYFHPFIYSSPSTDCCIIHVYLQIQFVSPERAERADNHFQNTLETYVLRPLPTTPNEALFQTGHSPLRTSIYYVLKIDSTFREKK